MKEQSISAFSFALVGDLQRTHAEDTLKQIRTTGNAGLREHLLSEHNEWSSELHSFSTVIPPQYRNIEHNIKTTFGYYLGFVYREWLISKMIKIAPLISPSQLDAWSYGLASALVLPAAKYN